MVNLIVEFILKGLRCKTIEISVVKYFNNFHTFDKSICIQFGKHEYINSCYLHIDENNIMNRFLVKYQDTHDGALSLPFKMNEYELNQVRQEIEDYVGITIEDMVQ